jgi:hypothetical protein
MNPWDPVRGEGGSHALSHGLTDDIPYLKNQERLTFARASASPIR